MNTVTTTFDNLDYANWDQYILDANFMSLRMVSFHIEENWDLSMTFKGDCKKIKAFGKWLVNQKNWPKRTLAA